MEKKNPTPQIIMDLEKLNMYNAEGCPSCGKKFSLGDMAVPACGFWEGGAKYIHENEAIFDKKSQPTTSADDTTVRKKSDKLIRAQEEISRLKNAE